MGVRFAFSSEGKQANKTAGNRALESLAKKTQCKKIGSVLIAVFDSYTKDAKMSTQTSHLSRKSKTFLDCWLQYVDSGFPVQDSSFQSLAGFPILCAEFRIPKTRIQDLTRKENSRITGRNPDYFTCGNKPLHITLFGNSDSRLWAWATCAATCWLRLMWTPGCAVWLDLLQADLLASTTCIRGHLI